MAPSTRATRWPTASRSSTPPLVAQATTRPSGAGRASTRRSAIPKTTCASPAESEPTTPSRPVSQKTCDPSADHRTACKRGFSSGRSPTRACGVRRRRHRRRRGCRRRRHRRCPAPRRSARGRGAERTVRCEASRRSPASRSQRRRASRPLGARPGRRSWTASSRKDAASDPRSPSARSHQRPRAASGEGRGSTASHTSLPERRRRTSRSAQSPLCRNPLRTPKARRRPATRGRGRGVGASGDGAIGDDSARREQSEHRPMRGTTQPPATVRVLDVVTAPSRSVPRHPRGTTLGGRGIRCTCSSPGRTALSRDNSRP